MNDIIDCSWLKPVAGRLCLLLCSSVGASFPVAAYAQQPNVVHATGECPPGMMPGAGIQQVQLPDSRQYYEYLPRGRDWDQYADSPLERFLKQVGSQTYTRFDYLLWSVSDPSQGIIGAPGKRLDENVGFEKPAFIDMARANQIVGFDQFYPIRNPLLRSNPDGLVLIQIWESDPSELVDLDGDLFEYDIIDADMDGFNDDDNDLDIFPRVTNTQKLSFLRGDENPATGGAGNVLVPTTGVAGDPAQVAVLTVGRMANTRSFQLDNNNGFRGVIGVDTTFGAVEFDFFTMGESDTGLEWTPIPDGLLGTPGGALGAGAADPAVIPFLVNGQMAPDIFDTAGNLITDSNNYYVIFNDSYRATYESEAWGFDPNVYWTINERPDRFKIAGSLGFRYFDFREQFRQVGSFTQEASDPLRPFYVYDNELQDTNTATDDDLLSVINSVTENRVMGPQIGMRTQVGDDRFSVNLDTHVMAGVNTWEAEVAVDDLLFVGDDNFTEASSTDFSAGFEMVLDARLRLRDHVTLTAGYNFLWFTDITRPDENIYYNINATRLPATANGTQSVGPDWDVSNGVVVRKEETTISLSGLSVGVLIDW